MTDKEKIISEIQRRINLFRKDGKLGSDTEIALYGLINYINAMQEETVSDDLKKFAEEWDESLYRADAVIAGANWQKQQMRKAAVERQI